MLTADQMRAVLVEVDYRPLWQLTIEEDEHEGPYLRIVATVENSYRHELVDLGIDTYPSPNDRDNEIAFYRFLAWRLGRIESHESREWLRRNGQAIFDPHAGALGGT